MTDWVGALGRRKILWKTMPTGSQGSAQVELDGETVSVSWKQDSDGIWIELPYGCYGYDIYGEQDDPQSGLVFRVNQRGGERVSEGVRVRSASELQMQSASGSQRKSVRVRAQMPGKIVRVLVQAGDQIEKDQPLLVMEAMKMENEIRATAPGKVEAIRVVEGQAVESGADLLVLG